MSNTYRRLQAKKNGTAIWKISDHKNNRYYGNCSNQDLVKIVSDASIADYGKCPNKNEFLKQVKMNSLLLNEGGKWFMPMFSYLDVELVKA